MKAISLAANERELVKSTGSKKLRNSGLLPGVLYGIGDPKNIELYTNNGRLAWHDQIGSLRFIECECIIDDVTYLNFEGNTFFYNLEFYCP